MTSQLIDQVLKLTNEERSKAGLKSLTLNTQLTQAAQGHSGSMAEDDFFSHTGVDGSDVGDRVEDTGYEYSSAGENIAAGQKTAAEVVEGWMNSPGHRANILNAEFTEIGIGHELLENDTGQVNYHHYWTQVFGTPLGDKNGDNKGQVNNDQVDLPEEKNNNLVPVQDNNSNNIPEKDKGDDLAPDKDNSDPVNVDPSVPKNTLESTPKSPILNENNDLAPKPTLDDKAAETDIDSTQDKSSGNNLDSNLFGTVGRDSFDDITGSSDHGLITGEKNAVKFTDSQEKSDKNPLSYNTSADFVDLINGSRNLELGISDGDLNNREMIFGENFASFELDQNQQLQNIENSESLF